MIVSMPLAGPDNDSHIPSAIRHFRRQAYQNTQAEPLPEYLISRVLNALNAYIHMHCLFQWVGPFLWIQGFSLSLSITSTDLPDIHIVIRHRRRGELLEIRMTPTWSKIQQLRTVFFSRHD